MYLRPEKRGHSLHSLLEVQCESSRGNDLIRTGSENGEEAIGAPMSGGCSKRGGWNMHHANLMF